MKKLLVLLGLSAFLAFGTMFAMNHTSKWNETKTKLNKNTEVEVCKECWEKKEGKHALGLKQIKIYNNCSYEVTVSYEYWYDKKWVPVNFGVKAGTESSWWPANDYRCFKCE